MDAFSTVSHGTALASTELKINYLEPMSGERILAKGRVLRNGRNFIVTEGEVFDKKGKLAAKALLSFVAARGLRSHKLHLFVVVGIACSVFVRVLNLSTIR